LRQVVANANVIRHAELAKAAAAKTKRDRKLHLDRAYAAVSQPAIAQAFYDDIAGGGVPVCNIEAWLLDEHHLCLSVMQPMGVGDSVYGANPFERPFLLIELSPTLRLHGQYIGLDKVGHFFQQGHEYYDRYLDARRDGRSEAAATQAAVAGGVSQEHGFYGEAIIGIYSNADLAANYNGLLFYRNLFEPVRLNGQTIEPMITWHGDELVVSPRCETDLLKPFITDHWNEAMNPCHYVGYWRPFVRDRIAGRIDAWMAFNHSTPAIEAAREQTMTTIDGVNYGHSGWHDGITLTNAASPDVVASR
jgi:hypothetical protein